MEYKNKKTGVIISAASKLAGDWIPFKKENTKKAKKEQLNEEDIEEAKEEEPKKK